MPDYRRYCSTAGITGPEMIEAIREKFPKYSKSTNSMVNNPADYAVRLTEEAELHLVNRFGFAPGLDVKAPRNHGNKVKPHRLYVRVNAELRGRLETVKARLHFSTDQDLVEAALWQFCDKYGEVIRP